MLDLLDRAADDEKLKPECTRQRAVITLKRAREIAQFGKPIALPWRYQAIVEADAQRIVTVRHLNPTHHGDVLPRPAHADHLDAWTFAHSLAVAQETFEQTEHL